MEVVRNIQLKLDVPEDNHEVLDETFEQFRQAAQHVADHGWNDNPYNITDTKNTLHKETYSDVRENLSLQSSLVQSARNLAATALGNCKDRILEDGKKASKPDASNPLFRMGRFSGRTTTNFSLKRKRKSTSSTSMRPGLRVLRRSTSSFC